MYVCMDTIFDFSEARELFSLTNDDNRNIAWDTDKLDDDTDIWTPVTEDDYKFLSRLVLMQNLNRILYSTIMFLLVIRNHPLYSFSR
ncbi:unknown [Taterapox virus]|uniref:Uncharacterized protein n=1 Tax=Taterapox virus TaxID=28871 RepID=Q0NPJ9_9POXV|nr:hypothetical protein TATV_DAH68_012 [Taterapox virus]ABD97578.1 unknown [Taterapox virus]